MNNISRANAIIIGYATGVLLSVFGLILLLIPLNAQKHDPLAFIQGIFITFWFVTFGISLLICYILHLTGITVIIIGFAAQGICGGIVGYFLWLFNRKSREASNWWFVAKVVIILLVIGAISVLIAHIYDCENLVSAVFPDTIRGIRNCLSGAK